METKTCWDSWIFISNKDFLSLSPTVICFTSIPIVAPRRRWRWPCWITCLTGKRRLVPTSLGWANMGRNSSTPSWSTELDVSHEKPKKHPKGTWSASCIYKPIMLSSAAYWSCCYCSGTSCFHACEDSHGGIKGNRGTHSFSELLLLNFIKKFI